MDIDGPLMRWLWPLLASLAGAVTALSFRPYRRMKAIDIAMTLFVGTSFAVFVGPWVGHMVFGNENPNFRVLGAILYLMATGSNILIPVLIKHLRRFIDPGAGGTEDASS